MTELQQLNAQLAEIRRAQAGIAAKLGDLSAEKFELESDAHDKAAAVEAAEVALVASLAAAELGEQTDTDAARKALDDAKAQASMVSETATRLRVIDALRARHEAEHTAIHEKGLSIMAAIKQAETETLVLVANGIYNDCETALEQLAEAEPRLLAARALLSERGHPWHLPQLNEAVVRSRFNHLTPNVCRASVLAELSA